jgi:hypothetical protein
MGRLRSIRIDIIGVSPIGRVGTGVVPAWRPFTKEACMHDTTDKVIRRDIPVHAGRERPAPGKSAEIRRKLLDAAEALESARREAFGDRERERRF